MGLLNWLYSGRAFTKALNPEKVVKINGIYFTIRKLNPLHYLAGAQVLKKVHDIYQRPDKQETPIDQAMISKIESHYKEVFMMGIASVRLHGVELQLSRKPITEEEKGSKLPVEHLMTDWFLAEELYAAILEFTYGKKKIKQSLLRKTA